MKHFAASAPSNYIAIIYVRMYSNKMVGHLGTAPSISWSRPGVLIFLTHAR